MRKKAILAFVASFSQLKLVAGCSRIVTEAAFGTEFAVAIPQVITWSSVRDMSVTGARRGSNAAYCLAIIGSSDTGAGKRCSGCSKGERRVLMARRSNTCRCLWSECRFNGARSMRGNV